MTLCCDACTSTGDTLTSIHQQVKEVVDASAAARVASLQAMEDTLAVESDDEQEAAKSEEDDDLEA